MKIQAQNEESITMIIVRFAPPLVLNPANWSNIGDFRGIKTGVILVIPNKSHNSSCRSAFCPYN